MRNTRSFVKFAAACSLGLGCVAPVAAQSSPDPINDTSTCQTITGEAQIDGTLQQITGRACRQPDGTWQIDSDDGLAVYPIGAYPYAYPYYYDALYWGPPVVFGFGGAFVFVDHFHHFYHMNHVRYGRPNGGWRSGGWHGGTGGGWHAGGSVPMMSGGGRRR